VNFLAIRFSRVFGIVKSLWLLNHRCISRSGGFLFLTIWSRQCRPSLLEAKTGRLVKYARSKTIKITQGISSELHSHYETENLEFYTC